MFLLAELRRELRAEVLGLEHGADFDLRLLVTLFSEELPWLRGRDLELVMGRAVCDWLGWKR